MAEQFERLHLPSPGALPGVPGIHSGTIIIDHKGGVKRVLTLAQWEAEIAAKEKAQKAAKDEIIHISGTDQDGNPVAETVMIDGAVRATAEFIMQARGE